MKQFKHRPAPVIVYGKHIEAPLARMWHVAHKFAGNQKQFLLFGAVNGGFGGFDIAGGARLDLDETKNIFLPANQVEFAAMIRGAVVAGNDHVSVAAKIEISILFATPSYLLMSGRGIRRERANREPVERAYDGASNLSVEHDLLTYL